MANNELPAYLYKYCSAGRATQILTDLALYLASSSQLNDLFEFRFRSLLAEPADRKMYVMIRRLLAEGSAHNVEAATELASRMSPEDLDKTYESAVHFVSNFADDVRRNSGVTCFSSARNNQRMWATYGDNHSGAVIEFSTAPELCSFRGRLAPVIYVSQRVPWGPEQLLTDAFEPDIKRMHYLMQIKHVDWRDEFEWRVLFVSDSAMSQDERLVPFQPQAVTRVYVGPRITPEAEAKIRSVVRSHLPKVPVFKREIHESLAIESPDGVEELQTREQFEYWADSIAAVNRRSSDA